METREVTERVGKVHLEIHQDVHAKGYLTCKLFLKILKRHRCFLLTLMCILPQSPWMWVSSFSSQAD